jgi:hypothetical protein
MENSKKERKDVYTSATKNRKNGPMCSLVAGGIDFPEQRFEDVLAERAAQLVEYLDHIVNDVQLVEYLDHIVNDMQLVEYIYQMTCSLSTTSTTL